MTDVPPSRLLSTDVERAVGVLRAGGLLVLPTETVYGLGADASSPSAVARVYAVKGRPADHPLIVHVAGAGDLTEWAVDVPAYAQRLAKALWPGPLTLVLPRSPRAGDHVTGGQATVGLRSPAHPVAQAVLARFGGGVAAPSANRFGRVSPTTAAHVVEEIDGLLVPGVDLVLDGGPCRIGVESTILDCTGPAPRLLRPGAVTSAVVEEVGGVPVDPAGSPLRAPGTLATHYAPRAAVRVVAADDVETAVVAAAGTDLRADGRAPVVGLLAPATVPTPAGVVRLSAPVDAAGYARVLYAALREADALRLRQVVAVPPDDEGIGSAVADRLRRAATGSPPQVTP